MGHGERRFHLVGHDWGGSLSWVMAHRRPERLASLTMFSRPHPGSFARAMRDDPEQPQRSRHHKAFLQPDAGPKLLAGGDRQSGEQGTSVSVRVDLRGRRILDKKYSYLHIHTNEHNI